VIGDFFNLTSVKTWSTDHVAWFFQELGHADSAAIFKREEIDGAALLLMERSDIFLRFGLKMGMNKMIAWKKKTPPPTPFSIVDEANREFEKRFNEKNSAGVGELYCKEGSLAPPGADGKVFHGPAEIAGFWQGAMDAGLTNLQLTTGEVVGYGDHFVETSAYTHSAGHGNYCVVWQLEDGKWKLLKDIFNV